MPNFTACDRCRGRYEIVKPEHIPRKNDRLPDNVASLFPVAYIPHPKKWLLD